MLSHPPSLQKLTLLANGTTGTTMVIFRSKWRARERKTEEKRRYVRFFCPKYHWPTESGNDGHPTVTTPIFPHPEPVENANFTRIFVLSPSRCTTHEHSSGSELS
jgi:hypothetical protein